MNNRWSDEYKWFFGENSDAEGFNHPGISEFKSIKYDGLAREIIQNSLDASDDKTKPVKVIFEHLKLPMEYFPDQVGLLKTLNLCIHYIQEDEPNNKNIKELEDLKTMLLQRNKIGNFEVLKISDYNTKGLSMYKENGEKSEFKGTSWANLVRVTGNSYKKEGDGGSFGLGKFAPFVFSSIRTVMYSSKSATDGSVTMQGKTILSAHHDNGLKKSHIGFFGQKRSSKINDRINEDCFAITNNDDIPEQFLRRENGTDIYILNAKILANEWFDIVAMSVIKNFFFSILNNLLEVEIIPYGNDSKRIIINATTIYSICEEYSLSEIKMKTTLEYINIIDKQKIEPVEKGFVLPDNNIGTMKLFLYSNEKIDSKVISHIRKTGMVIEEKKYRFPINYIGLLVTSNDNMNIFLRECEAPKHDKWSSNNYTESEEKQKQAGNILKLIEEWEKEEIKKLYVVPTTEKIDPFGMEEYLPSDYDSVDGENQNETKINLYKPLETELKLKEMNKRTYVDNSLTDSSFNMDEEGEDYEGTDGSNNEGSGNRHKGNGSELGYKQGTEKGNYKEKKSVSIDNIRTPYLNVFGKYRIAFTPRENATNVKLSIRRFDSSLMCEEVEIEKIYLIKNETKIEISDLYLIANKPICLEVLLKDVDREALEVKCYVEK